MSITNEIRERINSLGDGDIIMTADFADISSITTARKCLSRLVDDGLIRRVFDGVYEKPYYSVFLKSYLPTDPEKVAYALARNFHWTISPCGDIALHKLGLSTQVPAVWSYVSDGPYREFSWDNIKIKFKHKTNRQISNMSPTTLLIIEAVKSLGKNRIDAIVIQQLCKSLNKEDKKLVLMEATNCSEWIYETIRRVCAE